MSAKPPAWVWTLPFVFAILFWASFHPLNLGFLGWVEFIPLLIYARVTSGKKSFFVAWAGGYLAFLLGFSWFAYTVPIGPWLTAIYQGLYVPLFVVLVRRLGALWAPAIWVSGEYLRGWLFSGLPWLCVGYTQHDVLYLIQIADLGGVWLVSALVVFVNAAIVDERRAPKYVAAALMAASVIYGAIRVNTIPLKDGPSVAVVQPNIPQVLKKASLDDEEQAILNYEKHVALTRKAAAEKPDLVVWPEAANYQGLVMKHGETAEWARTRWYVRLLDPAEEAGIPMVIGTLIKDRWPDRDPQYSNSAVLIEPGKGIVGRYDKVHLVPFAEQYWIFKGIVRKVSGLMLESMTPGTDFPIWEVKGTRYGTQICFEAIFPEISREIARKGAAFTVNISNDGWFKTSGELDQMLAMARFRSIENRMHVIRATNTGISAFIEPTGRVQAKIEVDGRMKEVEGTLVGRIKLTDASSLYRALGDWAAYGALVLAAAALGRRIFVDRKKGSA